ncbi:putative nuclear protein [Neofusicoccum parvum]|uniref:Nuclear protein n=1 Tax=Neofusicoccum parvum TaxID=310453 RepID=A0ACB5S350_9PEZI|nr:putative nuclear protein [Neofusicoccum parvum]
MSQHMPAGSLHSFRDVGGPFSQIWDLLGLLPRRKSTADRLTECFLEELNWAIDAVHPTAFRSQYQAFWARKFGFDDLASIDLRWLALLFIVLAYGVLLDCPQPLNIDMQRELEETSLRFYWAARRAIVIAPTFYGEKSWLTTSFAMRMAQAQGMHIDGERWRLSRKDTETRRRLWSNLYLLDKTIALSLGRPFAIVDQQCLVEKASNVWLDDMSDDAAASAPVLPISEPTPSVSNRLCHELAIIVGAIQEKCFGLFTVSYDTVLALDREILEWRKRLPPYFRLEDPDLSLDSRLPFLAWNRLHIHSMYHFARVTLHRPYLLRPSITNRFRLSHDACISSACADLSMRLQSLGQPLQDRLRWTLGPHYLFNSALVLGIIAVRDPASRRSLAILEDLAAYCEMQRKDIWVNEFSLAEVKIVELCIKKARELRSVSETAISNVSSAARLIPDMHTPSSLDDTHLVMSDGAATFEQATSLDLTGLNGSASWQPLPWDDSFTFPEAADLQSWEQVIDSITQNQTRAF